MKSTPVIGVVVWRDAHGDSAHVEGDVDPISGFHKPFIYTSVGFIIKSDGAGVTMAGDSGEDGGWRDRDFIPRELIEDEWVVGKLHKPKQRKVKDVSNDAK